MTHYETVFILNPVLSESQIKEPVEKFKKYLENEGAQIVSEEYWGLRKLAYSIQKKKSGFYQLIEFKTTNGSLIQNLELQMRRDERVMRYLTVRLDRHALEYSVERRKKQLEKS